MTRRNSDVVVFGSWMIDENDDNLVVAESPPWRWEVVPHVNHHHTLSIFFFPNPCHISSLSLCSFPPTYEESSPPWLLLPSFLLVVLRMALRIVTTTTRTTTRTRSEPWKNVVTSRRSSRKMSCRRPACHRRCMVITFSCRRKSFMNPLAMAVPTSIVSVVLGRLCQRTTIKHCFFVLRVYNIMLFHTHYFIMVALASPESLRCVGRNQWIAYFDLFTTTYWVGWKEHGVSLPVGCKLRTKEGRLYVLKESLPANGW